MTQSFRSRSPIPETSDDDGLKFQEIMVEADIEQSKYNFYII